MDGGEEGQDGQDGQDRLPGWQDGVAQQEASYSADWTNNIHLLDQDLVDEQAQT